jgi:metal-responsive CopG/Arc/MetJ family transcriptional regulator
MAHERTRYDALVQVKAPKSFANALDRAADSHMMSRSDFIRAALVDRLRADGIDVDRLAGAALS